MKNEKIGGLIMLRIILYLAVAVIGLALGFFVGNRNKNYHDFVIRQHKFQDEQYDRIYGNG